MKQKGKNSFTVNMSMDELKDVIQSIDLYAFEVGIPFHLRGNWIDWTDKTCVRYYEVRSGQVLVSLIAKGDLDASSCDVHLEYRPGFHTMLGWHLFASICSFMMLFVEDGQICAVFLIYLMAFWLWILIDWIINRSARENILPVLLGILGIEDLQTVLETIR